MLRPGLRFILASSSPRRREMLTEAGFVFEIMPANIDEAPLPQESPQKMVERLAAEKAAVLAKQFPDALILGADTTVVWGDEVLGKPSDEHEAKVMLSKLQGSVHTVWSAFALKSLSHKVNVLSSSSTEVKMSSLSSNEVSCYVATGEPMDKAGAYAIQGRGAQLIEWVRGSYTSVVGLNINAVVGALREQGLLAQ